MRKFFRETCKKTKQTKKNKILTEKHTAKPGKANMKIPFDSINQFKMSSQRWCIQQIKTHSSTEWLSNKGMIDDTKPGLMDNVENAPTTKDTIRALLKLILLENILCIIWPDKEHKPETDNEIIRRLHKDFPDKQALWGFFRLTELYHQGD